MLGISDPVFELQVGAADTLRRSAAPPCKLLLACGFSRCAGAQLGKRAGRRFALIEMGASGLGNAYAGAGAVADTSTAWFNLQGRWSR